jgi:hypothetical protein
MFKKAYNILIIIGIVYVLVNLNISSSKYDMKTLKLNFYNKNQVTHKSKPINGVVEEDLLCSISDETYHSKANYKNGYLTGKVSFSTRRTGENIIINRKADLDLEEIKSGRTRGDIRLKTITTTEVVEGSEYLITEEMLNFHGVYTISLFHLAQFLFKTPKEKLEMDLKEEILTRITSAKVRRTVVVRNEIDGKIGKINKDRSYIEEYTFENNNMIGKYYKKDLDENLIETASYNDKGQLQGWRTVFEDGIILNTFYYTYGYLVIKEDYDNLGNLTTKEEYINGESNRITTYKPNGEVSNIMFKKGNSWRIYED